MPCLSFNGMPSPFHVQGCAAARWGACSGGLAAAGPSRRALRRQRAAGRAAAPRGGWRRRGVRQRGLQGGPNLNTCSRCTRGDLHSKPTPLLLVRTAACLPALLQLGPRDLQSRTCVLAPRWGPDAGGKLGGVSTDADALAQTVSGRRMGGLWKAGTSHMWSGTSAEATVWRGAVASSPAGSPLCLCRAPHTPVPRPTPRHPPHSPPPPLSLALGANPAGRRPV